MTDPARPGLLIINADDLGLTPPDTDAILDCFATGAITSATAMVWMSDSERAAARARDSGLPVGLHLNLIEPYSGGDVPPRVADTQGRVAERLRDRGLRAHAYHPAWRTDFERCIEDQLSQFAVLYRRAPTHVDGHQHMHLVANALLARALGPVTRSRRPITRRPSETSRLSQAGRDALGWAMQRRFATTRWCFSVRALHPALGGDQLAPRLSLADCSSVEVMVHPGSEDERAVLAGPEWRAALAGHRLGSFADLPPR